MSSEGLRERSLSRPRALLLLKGQSLPLRVVSLGQYRALMRAGQRLELPPTVRVGFDHRGRYPGRILLLAESAPLQEQSQSTMFKLEYEALYSMDGKAPLMEFILTALGRPSVVPAAFSYECGGWFYRLDMEHNRA